MQLLLERLQEENQLNIDPFGQQENYGNYAELNNEVWNLKDEGNYLEPKTQTLSEGISFGNQRVPTFTDNVINENIR